MPALRVFSHLPLFSTQSSSLHILNVIAQYNLNCISLVMNEVGYVF